MTANERDKRHYRRPAKSARKQNAIRNHAGDSQGSLFESPGVRKETREVAEAGSKPFPSYEPNGRGHSPTNISAHERAAEAARNFDWEEFWKKTIDEPRRCKRCESDMRLIERYTKENITVSNWSCENKGCINHVRDTTKG